jgi:16S rRNA (adenine1518-N6/adenine1519-N6)-dimethyltransferase
VVSPVAPKKALGQNFLTDAGVLARIVEESGIEPEDEVLEIGSGPGTLTQALAGLGRRLIAVELDRRLVPGLRRRFAGRPEVEVVEADILRVDLRSLFPEGGEVVIGNIPYYLTGALLPRLLDEPPRPRRVVLLVQREVAERWTAPTCESVATLAVKTFTDARLAFTVPASAFDPPPKVESALVVMDVLKAPRVSGSDLKAFFAFAEKVFQFRRKQLGSSLARVTGRPAAEVAERLRAVTVEPARRPQELSVSEWDAVYRALAG